MPSKEEICRSKALPVSTFCKINLSENFFLYIAISKHYYLPFSFLVHGTGLRRSVVLAFFFPGMLNLQNWCAWSFAMALELFLESQF